MVNIMIAILVAKLAQLNVVLARVPHLVQLVKSKDLFLMELNALRNVEMESKLLEKLVMMEILRMLMDVQVPVQLNLVSPVQVLNPQSVLLLVLSVVTSKSTELVNNATKDLVEAADVKQLAFLKLATLVTATMSVLRIV